MRNVSKKYNHLLNMLPMDNLTTDLLSSSDPLNLPGIDAPYSRVSESELAGRQSVVVRLSLDHPDTWPNCIYENSRFATFIWHKYDNKLCLIASGMNTEKFRQQKCLSLDQLALKINKYIHKHN